MSRSRIEHVKIMIFTEPEDGYPPEEWEGLWAIPLGNKTFRLDNIPFYARNISCDDIIEADFVNGEYLFSRIIMESDNSTIRVIIYNLEQEIELRNKLIGLGCSIEGSGTPGFIAVNVTKDSVAEVINFLEAKHNNEELDFEEGAIR